MANSQDRPTTAYRQRILEEFLSCSICKKPYRQPKFLPCHHYFCQECLEVRHEQWLETCERAERPDPFRCPDCAHPVTLPTEGIAGLLNNHRIANLCEEFSKKTLLTPAYMQKGGQKNMCSSHPQNEIQLYCLKCKVPVCSDCITHSHSGHTTCEAKQIKDNIIAELDTGWQKMEASTNFLQEIKKRHKKLVDNKVQTQQEINKACDDQVKKIQDQRDKLLATVEKVFEDNMAALIEQKDQVLTQLVKLSILCERTEQLMEQEEGVWLLEDVDLAPALKERFQNVATPDEICEVKLCHFEPKKSGAHIELGKVTSQPMSDKQLLQSKVTDLDTRQVRSTNVSTIRVGNMWVKKVRFGGEGSCRGKFDGPVGVAVSQDDKLYIADLNNSRIQVFTMDGVYVREFTTTLPGGTGEKFEPCDVAIGRNDNLWVGICVDGMGNIIVADFGYGSLQMHDSQGRFQCDIGSGMERPCGVAVSPGGDVVVTDYKDHTVSVWTQG
ncbi:E3 ubiquitin-protein ligase TRIM71-like [Branchiostoma floridae]|uniref:RING-type E3 ubiquitin transferase n=1 Tax=Branchiostoma floridae TaxID=7739 RepID=A0A9J7HCT0_BRAFL|nr:E3 ubiquitin-protein ligase TRIM71-like [Branchiostoma floridae]